MDMTRAIFRFSSGCLLALCLHGAHAQQDGAGMHFDGRLQYASPCPSDGGDPPFAGTVTRERISGRAARGKTFDWPLKPDGSFAGAMELRPHQLGTKMQIYEGKVENGRVTVKAVFIVPGHPRTSCEAAATLPLQPAKPPAS